MQTNFSKFLRNTSTASTAVKSLLLAVSLFFLFIFLSSADAKVIRKTENPSWFTAKHELYFKDISLGQLISMLLPSNVRLSTDAVASGIKTSIKGKYSIEEILNQHKDNIEYTLSDDVLHLYGYVVRKYEISYLPSKYSSTQHYGSFGGFSSSGASAGGLIGGGGTTQSGGSTGSSSSPMQGTVSVEYRTTINFWDEIKQEIKELLQAVDVSEVPVTQTQPQTLDSATYLRPQQQQMPQQQRGYRSFVTINKAAGLVIAGGTVDKIRKVDAYIESIRNKLNESIEVDFTLIEVRNKKNVNTGINWQVVLRKLIYDKPYFLSVSTSNMGIKTPAQQSFDLNLTGSLYGTDQQSIILSALKEVADIKVITKTNFLLKNNTTVGFHTGAVTTFIDSLQSSASGDTVSYTVIKGSVLSGIDMTLSASIDKDNITLSLIPTLSNLVNLEQIRFGNNLMVQNPYVETKKSVATVTVKNGETAAIVGYNANNQSIQREGLPLLGDIPIIGLLFSRNTTVEDDASVVMLLTPKIKRQ